MNYFFVIMLIGFLLFIHELGHFVFAKLAGISIKYFSIGFGPKLFKKNIGTTEYSISLIPVGGYVLPDIETIEDLQKIPVGKRILFSLGGPIFNIVLGLMLYSILNAYASGFSVNNLLIKPFGQISNLSLHIVQSLSLLFSHPENLSGVVGIVSQGSRFIEGNVFNSMYFTILLSVNLAIFNLLPLPVLDGGKVLLYLLETITPKAIRLQIPLSIAGWFLILGLLVYTTCNDILHVFT